MQVETSYPIWLRILAGVVGTAVAAHLAVTALFVGPENVARDTANEALATYMLPMFQQDWNLFAPTPIRTERSLFVRAWYGDQRHTEWVNVTELEIETTVHHNIAPSRVGNVTRRLATRIGQQHARLTSEERLALAGNYHWDAWERLESRMMGMTDRSSAGRISYVLRYDRTITAYATQFAYAWWGDDPELTYVQIKTEDHTAPSFDDRHRNAMPQRRVRAFGRRPLVEFERQDREAFTAAIERFTQ